MALPVVRSYCRGHGLLAFVLVAAPVVAVAQTDEIQVYDAVIADHGIFNLMMHTNYTPIGRKTADFPGGIIPNHSVNGALEWAYGVTDWFEQGLYLPVESALLPGAWRDRLTASRYGNCSCGLMPRTTRSFTA